MHSLFVYTDYRLYLKEYFEEMKRSLPVFSYRYFARKAGLTSAGLYLRIVKGERNLTETTTEQFIKGLALTESEADYFRALVGFNQADSSSKKQQFYAVMLSMADFVRHHTLMASQYAYLDQWYHPVLRELAVLLPQPWTAKDMAELVVPVITEQEVQNGLNLLLTLGLLVKDSKGVYVQTEPAVRSGMSDAGMLALVRRRFHQQMIRWAGDSLDRFPVSQRLAMGMTLGVSSSCYDLLCQEISAFQQRIASLVDKDRGSDRVYQFNVQLFPLSLETTPQGEE